VLTRLLQGLEGIADRLLVLALCLRRLDEEVARRLDFSAKVWGTPGQSVSPRERACTWSSAAGRNTPSNQKRKGVCALWRPGIVPDSLTVAARPTTPVRSTRTLPAVVLLMRMPTLSFRKGRSMAASPCSPWRDAAGERNARRKAQWAALAGARRRCGATAPA